MMMADRTAMAYIQKLEKENAQLIGSAIEVRRQVATQLLAGMLANGITLDIDGERIGQKRAATAVALADTLIAQLQKGGA